MKEAQKKMGMKKKEVHMGDWRRSKNIDQILLGAKNIASSNFESQMPCFLSIKVK